MKVVIEEPKKEVDSNVGDVVLFNDRKCMVIDMGHDSDYYGLLVLEGNESGIVVFKKKSLLQIDEVCSELLINNKDVVITKEGDL